MAALNIINAHGQVYWSTFCASKANGIYGLLFRRQPMIQRRWYGNKYNVVKYEIEKGQYNEDVIVLTYQSSERPGYTYIVNVAKEYRYTVIGCGGHRQWHDLESYYNYRALLNRFREYSELPFVPMDKRRQKIKDRWFDQKLVNWM